MAAPKKLANGRWKARYRGTDGRPRSRTFDGEREAKRWLAGVEVAKMRGEWVDPREGRVGFGLYASAWFATKADVAERTRINIDGRLRNHVVPFFGSTPMAKVRPIDVRTWVAEMVADGLAPSTVKAIYLTASQVFEQAVVDGVIARSPCVGVALPRDRQHAEVRFLAPEQITLLADTIDARYRTMIYLAGYGGLRAGEVAALRVERLHLLDQALDVVESASEVRGRLIYGPTKTGRPRTIPLPRFLAQMLGEHVGRYPSSDGFVFTAAEGGAIRHRNFYARHYVRAVAAAGLPVGLRFHDLRHSCAALLIANGRHMEEVKDHLGHSSIRVTSDRYGHLFPRAKRALADGLDATFTDSSASSARPTGTVHALRTAAGAP